MSRITDTADRFVQALERLHNGAGIIIGRQDMTAAQIGDMVEQMNVTMDRAQTAWGRINARGFTSAQIGRLLEFRLSGAVPANLAARLGNIRTAGNNATAAYISEVRAVHSGVERTWDDTNKRHEFTVITKAQRATFETHLTTMHGILDNLVG